MDERRIYQRMLSNVRVNEKTRGEIKVKLIKQNHTIVITNEEEKSLTLDFNGKKLKVFGDLGYDESAKIFFKSLNNFFEEAIKTQTAEKEKIINKIEKIFEKYDEAPCSYENDKSALEQIREIIEKKAPYSYAERFKLK